MLTNTTATLADLTRLAVSGQPVRIWRDAGNGARTQFCGDGVVTRANHLPEQGGR